MNLQKNWELLGSQMLPTKMALKSQYVWLLSELLWKVYKKVFAVFVRVGRAL